MGKYIIEVGDAYAEYICGKGDMLCLPVRINEFEDNWLNTNIPLTPYAEPDLEQIRKEAYDKGYEDATEEIGSDEQAIAEKAYQRGLIDAWEAARKIAVSVPLGGMSQLAITRMFGVEWQYVLMNCTPATVIEKIRQYEQEQEIQVGDEVKDDKDDTGVCTEISYPANSMHIMYADGTATDISLTGVAKTGRHFSEIAAVLAKMKEGS